MLASDPTKDQTIFNALTLAEPHGNHQNRQHQKHDLLSPPGNQQPQPPRHLPPPSRSQPTQSPSRPPTSQLLLLREPIILSSNKILRQPARNPPHVPSKEPLVLALIARIPINPRTARLRRRPRDPTASPPTVQISIPLSWTRAPTPPLFHRRAQPRTRPPASPARARRPIERHLLLLLLLLRTLTQEILLFLDEGRGAEGDVLGYRGVGLDMEAAGVARGAAAVRGRDLRAGVLVRHFFDR